MADNPHEWADDLDQWLPVSFEFFDPARSYDKSTVFLYDHYFSQHWRSALLETQLHQQYRVIYDYKNEHWIQHRDFETVKILQQYPDQHLWLHLGSQPGSWPNLRVHAVSAWYWLTHRRDLLNNTRPTIDFARSKQYKVFCMMNQCRDWRDQVWRALDQFEGQALRSYVEAGFFLPEDPDPTVVNQWKVNPNWYASSAMSLVCESTVQQVKNPRGEIQEFAFTDPVGVFLSEKTFKAIAQGHPFMLMACAGCLQAVRELGFETFGELWDESYDRIENFQHRLAAIMQQIRDFDPAALQQPVVQQKIQHNQQRLYDPAVIQSMLKTQLLDPIEQFLYEQT